MSVLFFIAILIGGRGSILGPGARHHHPDGVAGVRGTIGAVVDVPLRHTPAGNRAGSRVASPTCSTTRTAGRSSN
jgi:hypothetical protein